MATRLQSTTRWLRWLTPGLQIKRWLLLLMAAELVLVLGVAYALKEIYKNFTLPHEFFYITLQFWPYWARAVIFGVFGVGLLLFSYLKLTQSVLGPFMPGNSTSLIALADAEPLMKQLFDHRFKEGSLDGHSFGNLFIMAMADVTGNFEHALRESGKILAVKGTILPSTLQDVTLVASINGGMVAGESKIPM